MNGMLGMGMSGMGNMGNMGMLGGFPYSPQVTTFQQVRLTSVHRRHSKRLRPVRGRLRDGEYSATVSQSRPHDITSHLFITGGDNHKEARVGRHELHRVEHCGFRLWHALINHGDD